LQKAVENNVKVLFVGDDKQLPPVNEQFSRVFTSVKNQGKLTEVIRQKNSNPLMILLDILIKDIENGTNNFTRQIEKEPTLTNELGEGYCFLQDKNVYAQEVISHYNSVEYNHDKDYCKLFAYTNKTVSDWNIWIRNQRFPNVTEQIVLNDVLMSYNSVSIQKDGKQIEPIIHNSDDYVVEKVIREKNGYGVKGYHVTAFNIDTDEQRKFFVVSAENYSYFSEKQKELLAIAMVKSGLAWKTYYNFKAQNLIMSNIMDGKKLQVKKDIDYGYCITVHKSQGSTYENVFINGNNLNTVKDLELRKRLWYVALSRASKKATILLNF
jgi:exodeoxyribonuclease-5